MLTKGDDYPIHQTAEPIAYVGTSDRNFYDRYFFNGYAPDGSVYFAAALGSYPNRQVMDAAFNVVHRGRQYVLRASRLADLDRMETHAGPIHVEVVEPLRRLRLRVEPNEWGIAGDLLFTRRAPALEEPHFLRRIGGRIFMDYTRLTQHGEWSGTLSVDGASIDVGAQRFRGTRDRSWGVRPVGERETGAPAFPLQFFWLWAPLNFDDVCTHFDVNEDSDGAAWHAAGMIVPVGDSDAAETVQAMRAVSYQLTMRRGTRHAAAAEVILQPHDGADCRIRLTPLYNFYMIGLGYGHPQWGHGMFVGERAVTGESWMLSEVDPSIPYHLHIQAICEATFGKRRGIGILEQLILGPHKPTGFKDLFDLAD
jgi:hypothetical protein